MQRSIFFVLLACLASAACHAPLLLARPPMARRQQPLLALVLPPDSLAEVIVVDGGLNFLSLYQGVITIRILLSWFPQAQGIALLRPIFTASDVYLNLFRGVIPPIGGLDISPIGAFFVLNLLQNGVASLALTPAALANTRPKADGSRRLPGSRVLQALRERATA
jgi:YggT family protein|eukprot:jgi/Chrpa1/452/Chrysochromulina_OHIO_Genome00011230-RA